MAGTVIGGPLGLAAAGGLSALGDLGRGKNIGQALKGGVENAGLAGAGQALGAAAGYHGGLGALTGGGGESAAGSTAGSAAGSAVADAPIASAPTAASFESAAAPSTGGLSSVNVGGAIPDSALGMGGPPSSGGFLSSAGRTIGKIAHGAGENPLATAGVLQGLGGIASSGSENRLRSAQANALETQTGLTANQLAQRKASEAALAPYWSALAGAGSSRPSIAGNPYTGGA